MHCPRDLQPKSIHPHCITLTPISTSIRGKCIGWNKLLVSLQTMWHMLVGCRRIPTIWMEGLEHVQCYNPCSMIPLLCNARRIYQLCMVLCNYRSRACYTYIKSRNNGWFSCKCLPIHTILWLACESHSCFVIGKMQVWNYLLTNAQKWNVCAY